MGKTVTKSFNGENLQQMTKLTDYNNTVNENNLTPGGCLPLPQGYIHVYDHHFQTSPLKAKFYVETPWEGEQKFI